MSSSSSSDDWCTIESDPGVFTELIELWGCKGIEVTEIWDLSEVPSLDPCFGLIFLFPYKQQQQFGQQGQEEVMILDNTEANGLFFAHQVTTNACATQALLSVLMNASDSSGDSTNKQFFDLGPTLTEFKSFTASFPPSLLGMAIQSSDELRQAHNSFARAAEGFFADKIYIRNADDDDVADVYHFVAYVPYDGKLFELDGLKPGPVVIAPTIASHNDDSASINSHTNWKQLAVDHIQQRIQKEQHIKFNLLAVLPDKRLVLQEQLLSLQQQPPTDSRTDSENSSDHHGDDFHNYVMAQLEQEHMKREQWRIENQRRRFNYVPLCYQILREMARQRDTYQNYIQVAIEKKKEQQQQKRNK